MILLLRWVFFSPRFGEASRSGQRNELQPHFDHDRKTHPTWHSIIAGSVSEGRRYRADLMEAVKTVMTVKKGIECNNLADTIKTHTSKWICLIPETAVTSLLPHLQCTVCWHLQRRKEKKTVCRKSSIQGLLVSHIIFSDILSSHTPLTAKSPHASQLFLVFSFSSASKEELSPKYVNFTTKRTIFLQ